MRARADRLAGRATAPRGWPPDRHRAGERRRRRRRPGAGIADAFTGKPGDLGYSPERDTWEVTDASGLIGFVPIEALAWVDFPNDATCFTS